MSKFKEGMIINCKTNEEAIKLGVELKKEGYSWYNRKIDNNMNWNTYKENTAYWIKFNKTIEYSRAEWYEKNGYGKVIPFDKLFPNNQSIHITVDGTTTVAILKDGKNVVKRTEAKLSEDDTFDFNIGAKIALNRLFDVESVKLCDNESNLYICIKDFNVGEWLTKGKIYSFVDGRFTFDNSYKSAKYKSFEDFKKSNPQLALCLQHIDKNNKESTPQVKEVKRKAKVGEWVKVVNASLFKSNKYKNGDIVCITEIDDDGIGFGNNDLYKQMCDDEYVVLENYTPQQEQAKSYTQEEFEEAIKAERERIYEEMKKIFDK